MAGAIRLLCGTWCAGVVALAFGCGRTELFGGRVHGSGIQEGGTLGEGGRSSHGGAKPSSGASQGGAFAGATSGGNANGGNSNGGSSRGGNSNGGSARGGNAGRNEAGSGGDAGVAGWSLGGVAGSEEGGSGGADRCDPTCAPGEDCRAGECVCQRPFQLLKVSPPNAALDVARSSPAIATFSCVPSYSGDLGGAMHLYSDGAGLLSASFPAPINAWEIVLRPERPAHRDAAFFPGERITGWLARDLAGPYIWQFWASVRRNSSARFENSGQALDSAQEVELGDLDRDGDLDALTWNGSAFEILANDGHGRFATTATAGDLSTRPKLADFDGDGDLDIAGSALWINQGGLSFLKSGQSFDSPYVAADFDGDGDLDVFAITDTSIPGQPSTWGWTLFVNLGGDTFARNSVAGEGWLYSAQGGDVDNDGDIDLVILPVSLSRTPPLRASLLLNDGAGSFTEVESPFEVDATREIALGDLDGDGDLDVFTASWGAAGARNPDNRIWLNDGHAHFLRGSVPSSGSIHVVFGDLDGDGDLDAVAGQHDPYSVTPGEPSQVLLNDGSGNFSVAGELGGPNFQHVRLGDLDGDGDLDAFTAEWDWFDEMPAQVFLQVD